MNFGEDLGDLGTGSLVSEATEFRFLRGWGVGRGKPASWRGQDSQNSSSSQFGLLGSGRKIPASKNPGRSWVPGLGNKGRRKPGLFSNCDEITLKVAENKRLCTDGKLESGVRKELGGPGESSGVLLSWLQSRSVQVDVPEVQKDPITSLSPLRVKHPVTLPAAKSGSSLWLCLLHVLCLSVPDRT